MLLAPTSFLKRRSPIGDDWAERAKDFRFLHVSTDEVYGALTGRGTLHRGDPLRPAFALFGDQGGIGSSGEGLGPHLRAADSAHELLE